jgi:hypothetical protein
MLRPNIALLHLCAVSAVQYYTSGVGEPIYDDEVYTTDFATLAEDKISQLPSQFTICSSISTDAFKTPNSLFLLRRETGEPWFNVYTWPYKPRESLTFRLEVQV